NGLAKNSKIKEGSKDAKVFEENLLSIATELAREIARDGEGAKHLITVRVQGARSYKSAKQVAMTVANSPLVKTAIYGRDANWGRITAAAGRAGVPFSASALCLRFNDFLIFENGRPVDFDEAALTKTLSEPEVQIDLSVGKGGGDATVWTCDFTEDYIRINADYRS
ncbi:TPA: hypothetical protein DDW35_07920, partial [Candidatus Sumerlaeota bacterium]|nr:hypothetical protein [Candidatus Sumerlaeota bacterium]